MLSFSPSKQGVIKRDGAELIEFSPSHPSRGLLGPHTTSEPSAPVRDFDTVLAIGREAWLASPTGKARKAIAKADRLAADLSRRLADVATALSRGDGSEAAVIRMNAALLDLRLMVGDVEALARIVEASR